MKIYIYIKLGLLFFSTPILLFAQQTPKYTQYINNINVFNPGYIASNDNDLTFFGLYSTQLVGIEGAPKTANLSFFSPVSDKGLAIGFDIINDNTGATDENNISLNTAYNVELNQKYNLAFGLKTTVNFLSVDYTKLNIKDPDDPINQENINNKFSPNIGAGLFAYSDNSYLGLSIPNLFQTNRNVEKGYKTMSQRLHFYLIGGYVFDLNYNTLLKPAFLFKAVQGGTTQLDLTLNANIHHILTLGISYSTESSMAALIGFDIDKNWFVGYSISGQTNQLKNASAASHEFFIKYTIQNKRKRYTLNRVF